MKTSVQYVPVSLGASNKEIGIVLGQPTDYYSAIDQLKASGNYGAIWSLFTGRLLFF